MRRIICDLTLLSIVVFACSSGVTQTTPATGEAPPAAPEEKPPSPNDMQIFLLFGQSNMEGTPKPEAEDSSENPRVRVLAYTNCPGREYNQWYTATPPLHSCGFGVGPGDHFGKAMAEAWPNDTIGLVPAAIAGVDIDFFRKGVVSKRRGEFRIPPDNARSGAYEMLLEKARLAQQSGTIRGILFHQGESDTGNGEWPGKVAEVVRDLRADLGLGVDVPFVAGEVLHSGCCASHNPLVGQLPKAVPNAYVVSAEGLQGMDSAHFDLAGQRELGRRYAKAVLEALGQ
jgi:Carbohydrate esterase, sialic acid-specific acetylesterase